MGLSFEISNLLGGVYHRGTIKFGPDGHSLYSPVGNKILVHDLKKNKSSALPVQVNYNINQLSVHPDNTILLASSEKSHLYVIVLTSGKMLYMKEYKAFERIAHISFSPNGKYYCVCGHNLVLIYKTPGLSYSGRSISPFELHKKYKINHDTITTASWSADSEYLCIASADLSLSIAKSSGSDRIVYQVKAFSDDILSCYFTDRSGGDRQLYCITKKGQLSTWHENSGVDRTSDDSSQPTLVVPKEPALSLTRLSVHYLKLEPKPDETKEDNLRRVKSFLTSSDFNLCNQLLIVGYNTGDYSLYQMPDARLLHNLKMDAGRIDSVTINYTGDWIALGSSVDAEADHLLGTNKTESKLIVWEWKSESIIFNQSGSGATMTHMHECLSYSPDGTHIVAGNLSGRINVWNSMTGESVATFGQEHKGPIKAIKFVPNKSGKVIVSASLDGTIRAYDLNKFKNFRTFSSPVDERRPEFTCLSVDTTGEFIAAGTHNYFEVYLYSLQTGKFLEHLTGHEGPVTGVSFSPITNVLVSVSWDKTVRVWNLFEGSKCNRDIIPVSCEAITVTFRPDGSQFAVSLSNGQITFFDANSSEQLGGPIEGQHDLGTTQLTHETSRDSKKYFMTLNYSADGAYLIAGGKSNYVCIYHVEEKTLAKKFTLTINMSMDGMFDYISSRKRGEFGYNLELLDHRLEERSSKRIKLPGIGKGDLAERNFKPVIALFQIEYSPTMRSFSAATTEGILEYSLDVQDRFNPFHVLLDVNPESVRRALNMKDYGLALVQSTQLNDAELFTEALEKIPSSAINGIIDRLSIVYVRRILHLISRNLSKTKHLEYYVTCLKLILYKHGFMLKRGYSDETTSIIRDVHQTCQRRYTDLKKNCEFAKFSLQFFTKDLEFDEPMDIG